MAAQHSSVDGGRSPWGDRWVWTVFAVALGVRLLYLVDLRHTPFFSDPQMDALYHDQWARRLAAGDWWGSEVFFRAPLYPYFLGVLYALSGADQILVRVAQFMIGAGTALLTVVLPYRRIGRRPAVTAGLLVALYGPLIYFEGELFLVVLEAPMNLLAAWALDRAITSGGSREWVRAGISLGLAALVRPTILAMVPVVGITLLWRRRRRAVGVIAIYAGAVFLVLCPVLVRNYVVGHDLVPVASQGGLNYYLGNNPAADGRAAIAPEFRETWIGGVEDARRQAELARGRSLLPSETSNYWFGRALDWARESPADFFHLQIRKFGYFWDAFEIPNNQDYYFFSRLARLFRWPVLLSFSLLGPLALAGLVVGVRRKTLGIAWVAVPVTLMVVLVAFFVCGRFRVPLVPLFAIWAASGMWSAFEARRTGDMRTVVLYGSVLAASFVVMNADLHGLRARHSFAESHLRLGILHASRGREADALRHYNDAIEADSSFADGWNNLGVLHAQHGRPEEAGKAFETALVHTPRHPKALGNLASLAFQQGRRSQADSLARQALRVAGREPDALYNAAVVLGNLGDNETALLAFRELVRLEPRNARARVGEAKALILLGRRSEAVETLRVHPVEARSRELEALLREMDLP
jgi:tetratricopeptide (TPR) repeat protein